MDKLFEQIAKILPPPLLMGLLGICVVFFATFYARGYRAYGDVLQDGFFRNSAVMIAAIALLFWVNASRGMHLESKPVLIVPFFYRDEGEQYRIAFSNQIEGQLNEALRTNSSIFNLPSYLNDPETAKQVGRKYGATAVIYAATVIDTKDSRAACFKLMLLDPELTKTYSLVPMSMPQTQLGEIVTTLRGTVPLVASGQTIGSDTVRD